MDELYVPVTPHSPPSLLCVVGRPLWEMIGKLRTTLSIVQLLLWTISLSAAFSCHRPYICNRRMLPRVLLGETDDRDNTSSFESSDASSKGIVSSLTELVNFFMNSGENESGM